MGQPAASTRLSVEFAQASDPGRDPNKQVNEDSCGYVQCQFGHLAVLCDGMGGHYGGQEASRLAIKTIFEEMDRPESAGMTPALALKKAVEVAALKVYELGGPPENRTRPGSTVVAMVLHDKGVDVAHVGDSRAYVIRSNQIYPLTRDHSMVQGMIDAGQLTEEQALGHPDLNKITRALGMRPEVDVELRPEPMELFAGDMLLQTSDGITDLALSRDILGSIRQALSSGDLEYACTQLVQMANDRGGHDNITVQLARVTNVGPSPTAVPQATHTGEAGAVPTTVAMTSPQPPPAPTFGAPPGGHVAPTAPNGQVAITAADGAAAPIPPTAVGPTAADHAALAAAGLDAPPQSAPIWSSGMYNKNMPLAAYNMDAGAGALQLPPRAAPPFAAGGLSPTPPAAAVHAGAPGMAPAPTVDGSDAAAAYAAVQGMGGMGGAQGMGGHVGAGADYGYGGGVSPTAQGSRGGIVFIITGVSIALAILILLALWGLGLLD